MSMFQQINLQIVQGNVAKIKHTDKYVGLTICVNKKVKKSNQEEVDIAEWFNITVWRPVGDRRQDLAVFCDNVKEQDFVRIEGESKTTKKEDKIYRNIVVSGMEYMTSARIIFSKNSSGQGGAPQSNHSSSQAPSGEPSYDTPDTNFDDDDLPF